MNNNLNAKKLWGIALCVFGVIIFMGAKLLAEVYENSEISKLGFIVGIILFSVPGYFIFAAGFFEKEKKSD